MKIIVTGYKGFLGARVLKTFIDNNQDTTGIGRGEADISNYKQIKNVFSVIKPDLVVHCAAVGDIWKCEEDHDYCSRINIIGTRNIASICADFGTRLIFMSSDQVYNYYGEGKLREYTKPDPVNYYGLTKVKGEEEVRQIVNRHHILRLGWQYGWEEKGLPKSRDGLLENLYSCLKGGKRIRYILNSSQNITFIYDTVDVITKMANQEIPYGTYNVASENNMTDHEKKAYILKRLDASEGQVEKILFKDENGKKIDLRAEPYNLKLVGYEMPDFEEGLNRCFRELIRF